MSNITHVIHKIEVAQAFDELSILEIKKFESADSRQKKSLEEQIYILKTEIDQSIGFDLAKEIYCSNFYTDLYNANFDIFRSVDKFKDSEPAQLNVKRINAKRKIQEHFFGKTLEEIKI